MERALDLSLLEAALGGRSGLPDAETLQSMLSQVEIGLVLQTAEIDPILVQAGWYLHGVASVDGARERYTPQRQRQAFLVSAHIFDLAMDRTEGNSAHQFSLAFAAAIGYRRGGLEPNATAIANKANLNYSTTTEIASRLSTLSLEIGIAVLGLDIRRSQHWLRSLRNDLANLAAESGLEDLSSTAFGPTHLILLGVEDLLHYLRYGGSEQLDRARSLLYRVGVGEAGADDLNARWVATHLLKYLDDATDGSIWNRDLIPPDVPDLVRQSFTMTSPPVLTLWDPQRTLFAGPISPFAPSAKRMIMSVPTSGGKTLIGQFLAIEQLVRTNRGVCFITPTRSLAREIRRAISKRVRFLDKELGSESRDFASMWEIFDLFSPTTASADIDVMTPERLQNLLRHDPAGVLSNYGMFIFDEAQLLKEQGRGFVLESVIAALNYLTKKSEHKIVLISAAMGNVAAIAKWIDPAGDSLAHSSEWRGPRRLHAVFSTTPNWDMTVVERGKGTRWPYRHSTPLSGIIRLRMASGATKILSTEGVTGWKLVRKSQTRSSDRPQFDPAKSTRKYEIASDMIALLGHAGSVLVVASTKSQAQRLALAIAADRDEIMSLSPLVDFVTEQLTVDHPLVSCLRKGVGFHHAGLPVEVLEAIEEAVRDGSIDYLTCTSTLTDGVNLPVRTVVIYDQPYEGQPDDSRLRGARLVNAMGRAGRAGKETEGWIVLIRATAATEQDFIDLNPDADSLAITSSMASWSALEQVAEAERRSANGEDIIFEAVGAAANFIGFVWMMLAIEDEIGNAGETSIEHVVDATLVSTASPAIRDRYVNLAQLTQTRFIETERSSRSRWAKVGTSVSSARTIDLIASRISNILARNLADVNESITYALDILGPVMPELLDLPEAPRWHFRVSPQGEEIALDPKLILLDWIQGDSVAEMAAKHLPNASPASWRIEQVVGLMSQHFEHFLSWTISALIDIINVNLEEAGKDGKLCATLGAHVRYGVESPHALVLMENGIRSRRIAALVSRLAPDGLESTRESVREWLATQSMAKWREVLSASTSEVGDLLEFVRNRRRSLLRELLQSGETSTEFRLEAIGFLDNAAQEVRIETDTESGELAVIAGCVLIGRLNVETYLEIQTIIDSGIEVGVEAVKRAPGPTIVFRDRGFLTGSSYDSP